MPQYPFPIGILIAIPIAQAPTDFSPISHQFLTVCFSFFPANAPNQSLDEPRFSRLEGEHLEFTIHSRSTHATDNENGLDGEAPEEGAAEPATGSGTEHQDRLQPDREESERVSAISVFM